VISDDDDHDDDDDDDNNNNFEFALLNAWDYLRGGADKSLARLISRCRRTESWKTAGFRLNQ
jgi:hypothetical protein